MLLPFIYMLNWFDFVTCSCSRKIKNEIIYKSRGSINLLIEEKILKEIDAGIDSSINMAVYKLKSSANVSMIKKRGKEIEYGVNFQSCW